LSGEKPNCPCKDCLCVSICRQKMYNDLIASCKLIRKYLYTKEAEEEISLSKLVKVSSRVEKFDPRIKEVQDYIKSTEWCYHPLAKKIFSITRNNTQQY